MSFNNPCSHYIKFDIRSMFIGRKESICSFKTLKIYTIVASFYTSSLILFVLPLALNVDL